MWGQGGGGWGGGWGGQGGQQPRQQQQGWGGGGMWQGLMQRLQQQAPFGGMRPGMGGPQPQGQGNFAAPTPDQRMAQAQSNQAQNAGMQQQYAQNAGMQMPAPQSGGMQVTRSQLQQQPQVNYDKQQSAVNMYGAAQGAPIYRKQDEQY